MTVRRSRSAPSPQPKSGLSDYGQEATAHTSFDHPIGADENRIRDRDTENLGGLQVERQLDPGWLLDRQVGGLRSIDDLLHVIGRATVEIEARRAIAEERPGIGEFRKGGERRQPVRKRRRDNTLSQVEDRGVVDYQQSIG